MKALLWGGPEDGRTVHVPHGTREYQVPITYNPPTFGTYRFCPDHNPPLFEWVHYGEIPVRRDSDSEGEQA
ncbi:MAG TPA: hypothetical protein VLS51_00195 [Propionibacteriaceae bacterium]|nr:hypothetical protein [Propionibacteriaceae bacterium]